MMKGTTEARTGMTSDGGDGAPGAADQGPTDTRVQGLRERAMDLIADASIHAERINAAAARLGLTPDLLNGIGDQLYEAAVAQLDVASKILERSQAIADRLFELGTRRPEPATSLVRVDVTCGQPGSLRFVVRNAAREAAAVQVVVECDGGLALAARVGRRQLDGGRETSVEIPIPTDQALPGKVYAGTAKLALIYATERRVELPRRDFEIWVSGGG
jgi:hypothetical protein